jgi:CheY-like chemotaxis protein
MLAFRQDCRDIDAWPAGILLNRVDRLQNLSVMVVDHNRWSRLHVTDSLQQLGVSVVEASNGGSALRRALADVPHAVIVASGLPELDAPELMHALRENPRTRHTAIVALQDIPDCDADLALPCTPLDALASIVSALEVRRQALKVAPMRSVIASPRLAPCGHWSRAEFIRCSVHCVPAGKSRQPGAVSSND